MSLDVRVLTLIYSYQGRVTDLPGSQSDSEDRGRSRSGKESQVSTVLDLTELFVSSGYSGKSLICRQIILEFRGEVLLDI